MNRCAAQIAAKYGYPEITSMDDLTYFSTADRLLTNQRASLYTYINEYTYDMVPKSDRAFNGNCEFLTYISVQEMDMTQLEDMLTKRTKTLPSNGMLFKLDYQGTAYVPKEKRITEIFMKETYHNDSIVMLYNVTVNNQTLAGFFDTSCDFLSSVLLGTNALEDTDDIYQVLRSVILYLYAAATSKETEHMLRDFTDYVYLDDGYAQMKITVTAYAKGGKLLNHCIGTGARANDDRYEAVSRAIQGYIRKLPAGQSASVEAKERAVALGFDLTANETYVQPFMKNVLRLKGNTER